MKKLENNTKKRVYGVSHIIYHPSGFDYKGKYPSKKQALSYSKLLWAKWRKNNRYCLVAGMKVNIR